MEEVVFEFSKVIFNLFLTLGSIVGIFSFLVGINPDSNLLVEVFLKFFGAYISAYISNIILSFLNFIDDNKSKCWLSLIPLIIFFILITFFNTIYFSTIKEYFVKIINVVRILK